MKRKGKSDSINWKRRWWRKLYYHNDQISKEWKRKDRNKNRSSEFSKCILNIHVICSSDFLDWSVEVILSSDLQFANLPTFLNGTVRTYHGPWPREQERCGERAKMGVDGWGWNSMQSEIKCTTWGRWWNLYMDKSQVDSKYLEELSVHGHT